MFQLMKNLGITDDVNGIQAVDAVVDDSETVLFPILPLYISFNSLSQLSMISKPSDISSLLTRDWLYFDHFTCL